MIYLLTACLFIEILVHVLNIASAKARAKNVFVHLKGNFRRLKETLKVKKKVLEHHQIVDCHRKGTPGW